MSLLEQPLSGGPVRVIATPGAGIRRALRNRLSLAGVIVLGVLLLLVTLGPLVWTVSPTDQDLTDRLSGMTVRHPLGTDTLGRDVLSRLLSGGRVSLSLAISAVLASTLVGGAIGLVSGYLRGRIDSVLMRIMEVILSFPALVLALAIAGATGGGAFSTFVAVAVPGTPLYARLLRSMAISVRSREYIVAARATGVPVSRLLFRHVLPNSVSPLVVQATLGVGLALQYIAALGYLGLGVQPPTPEWGAILSDAQTYLVQEPLVLVAPGLVIAFAIISFNLLGDALRDLLDPGGGR
ncbi:MAG: ABC transporter permease [Chloroflexota bacterium]|nr:ABC transporter permease [Chloroflexota bacterium]